jgi:TolB-like protein
MFKDVEGGIARVAAEIDADYVIAGSLDLERDAIAVDVYLYRAGVEEAIWAERLDWATADSERLADELARRIAGSIADRNRK